MVYWDEDSRKDLLVGLADGTVRLYLNTGTDAAPSFDGGTPLQVGPSGSKTNIDVGSRATSSVVDWNSDGKKDLVVGAYDGRIHVFLNEGTDTAPDFRSVRFAQANGADLDVAAGRSSPAVAYFDGDVIKDVLVGYTNGKVFFYINMGTD